MWHYEQSMAGCRYIPSDEGTSKFFLTTFKRMIGMLTIMAR